MPFYQRLGDVPRKRHVQFRDNGTLLTEEVMGLEGFTGNESILYHLQSPCRVMELGGFEPKELEEWVPERAPAEPELATAEAVRVGAHALPGRHLPLDSRADILHACRFISASATCPGNGTSCIATTGRSSPRR